MNIDDSALERPQEFSFQNPHETREGNKVNLGLSQLFNKCALSILLELGTEFTGLNKTRGQISLTRPRQDAGVFDIAQNNRDFCGERARSSSIGQRDKVRSFA